MQDNSAFIFIVIAALLIIVLGVFLVVRKKSKSPIPISFIEQDSLTMKEVIAFFQRDSVIQELENNSNLLAVVTREKLNDGKIKLIVTLFDKQKNKIANTPHSKAYIVQSIDSDLEQNFGDRDMLILE